MAGLLIARLAPTCKMVTRRTAWLLPVLFACGSLWVAAAGADWLTQVPVRERQMKNPYREQPEAVQAGALLFADHCAQCHGRNAEGGNKKPSLRTERIQSQATEGDLHWLLVNGSLRRGMPSWSKLPDPQLWQIISYLRSLQLSK